MKALVAVVLLLALSGCSSPRVDDVPEPGSGPAPETPAAPVPTFVPTTNGFDLATAALAGGDLVLQFRLDNQGDGDCNVHVRTASVDPDGTGPTLIVVSSWDGQEPGWASFAQRPEARLQVGDMMDTDQEFGQGLETTGSANYTVAGHQELRMTYAVRSLQAWDNPRLGSDVLRWSLRCPGPYVLDNIRAGRSAELVSSFNGDGAAATYVAPGPATPTAGAQLRRQFEATAPIGLVLSDAMGSVVRVHAQTPDGADDRLYLPAQDPGLLALEAGPGTYAVHADVAQTSANWWAILAGVSDLARPEDVLTLAL